MQDEMERPWRSRTVRRPFHWPPITSLDVAFEFSLAEHIVWPAEGAPSASEVLLDATDHAVS